MKLNQSVSIIGPLGEVVNDFKISGFVKNQVEITRGNINLMVHKSRILQTPKAPEQAPEKAPEQALEQAPEKLWLKNSKQCKSYYYVKNKMGISFNVYNNKITDKTKKQLKNFIKTKQGNNVNDKKLVKKGYKQINPNDLKFMLNNE